MRSLLLWSALFLVACQPEKDDSTPVAKQESAPNDIQIKTALLAAPAEKRDSCTVMGYTANKELVVLRQGSNEMICLADDPNEPGFEVACYVKDLEPFMARGRELRKQGIRDQQLFDTRENEAKAGTLPMPKQPAALFVYSAKPEDVNMTTGEVKNGYLRYVIYIPYATIASTGLPEQPSSDGMPWIMYSGTHAAHIMINP